MPSRGAGPRTGCSGTARGRRTIPPFGGRQGQHAWCAASEPYRRIVDNLPARPGDLHRLPGVVGEVDVVCRVAHVLRVENLGRADVDLVTGPLGRQDLDDVQPRPEGLRGRGVPGILEEQSFEVLLIPRASDAMVFVVALDADTGVGPSAGIAVQLRVLTPQPDENRGVGPRDAAAPLIVRRQMRSKGSVEVPGEKL